MDDKLTGSEISKDDDAALNALFADARAARPALEDDFMARLVADADAALPSAPAFAPTPAPRSTFFQFLGGWPTVASMASCAVAGVWIGFAQPETLNMVAGYSSESETYDLASLLPGYGTSGFIEEDGG